MNTTSRFVQLTKELKAGRIILLRFFSFSVCALLFPLIRSWYSFKYFQYEIVVGDGFMQYSIFGLAFLFLWIYWKQLKEVSFKKHGTLSKIIFFSFAMICLFFPIRNYETINSVRLILMEYAIQGCGNLFLFFSFFGFTLLKKMKLQIATFIVITMFLSIAPILITEYWRYSSLITMVGLRWLLELFRVPFTMETVGFIVTIKDFKTSIGAPCAGIHSLIAFSALYLFGVLLTYDRTKNVSLAKVGFFFILGLASVYLLNSFRVMLILLVGAYYDAEFAINTFHNNIGAILFLIFFIFYSTFAYKHIGITEKRKNLSR